MKITWYRICASAITTLCFTPLANAQNIDAEIDAFRRSIVKPDISAVDICSDEIKRYFIAGDGFGRSHQTAAVSLVSSGTFNLGTKHLFVAQTFKPHKPRVVRYACYVTKKKVLWKLEELE